jgi:hypothetical protein
MSIKRLFDAVERSIYDSGNAATGHPALSKEGPDIRYLGVALS